MPVITESFESWSGPLLLFFEGGYTNSLGVLKANDSLLQEALNV